MAWTDALQLQDYRSAVAKTLGNLKSGDFWYSSIDDWTREALDEVVKTAMMLGGDNPLQNIETEFTDTTVAGQSNYTYPTTLLSVRFIGSFDSSSTVDLDTQKVRPVPFIDKDQYYLVTRDSTVTGYPRLYTRTGPTLRFWPTPDSTYVTKYLIIGPKRDSNLNNDTDSPVMDKMFQFAVLEKAIAIGMRRRGWYEEAPVHDDEALRRIQGAIALQAIELTQRRHMVNSGSPIWEALNG